MWVSYTVIPYIKQSVFNVNALTCREDKQNTYSQVLDTRLGMLINFSDFFPPRLLLLVS